MYIHVSVQNDIQFGFYERENETPRGVSTFTTVQKQQQEKPAKEEKQDEEDKKKKGIIRRDKYSGVCCVWVRIGV